MKKLLCIILMFAVGVSLFACGGGDVSSADDNESALPDGNSISPESKTESAKESSDAEDLSETISEEISEGPSEEPSEEEPESPYLDGKRLVVFGDSITALGSWGRTSAEKLNMYFFNGAMGGITSAQGIVRFPAYVAARDADYVTLLFGLNDMIMVTAGNPRVTPEQFEENMKTLVQMVRDCGAEPILLTANPLDPNKFWAAQGQSKSMYESVGGDPLAWEEVYNDVTRKVASETGAYLIDMFRACEGVNYNVLLYDGIHLASKGNQIFVDTLVEWFESNYEHDPEAEKIVENEAHMEVTAETGRISLYSDDPDAWYTVEPSLMSIQSYGGALRLANTNGLWPYAECLPESPLLISVEDGYLYYNIATNGVSASIIIFFDGATPSAYTEGTYVSINSRLGAKCNEVGDIMPNQTLKGKIKLSELNIPAKNIKDGMVLITGIKVFAAGTAYQQVMLRELSVGIETE